MAQADVITMIMSELTRQFGSTVPVGVIGLVAVKAVRDLRGSISAEALPEMALRLAQMRLLEQQRIIRMRTLGAGRANAAAGAA